MRKVTVEIICLLFIILFVYTAVSKFLDFDNFQAVIGQSPLITKMSVPLSHIVPISEIVIAILLMIPRHRMAGLRASFIAMLLFTFYIIILVTLSEKIPCSCGGVIQRMTWEQHLYFNVVFVVLASIGIILHARESNNHHNKSSIARA